jgi:ABC-type multidrug transport system fused ATPase/permease subunit
VLYEEGEISVGNITSFLLYMMQLIFNFLILSFVFGNAFRVSGAAKKVMDYMRYTPFVQSAGGLVFKESIEQAEIEFKGVSFSYPTKRDVQVLNNIDLQVAKNQVVALVGQSGCGKSSIIALIERFYKPDSGEILLNGEDISKIDPRWLKRHIGIVSQEPVLKSGSIRENICYGMDIEKVTEAQLDEACSKANALKFI